MNIFRLLVALAVLMSASAFAADGTDRVLEVDLSKNEKDLSHSQLGANAQLFRSHYSMNKLLEQGPAFAAFLSNIGNPVLRMDGRSVYGWFGLEETRKLREAEIKMKVLSRIKPEEAPDWKKFQPEDYESLVKKYKIANPPKDFTVRMNPPEVAWFSIDTFHAFCRSNRVKLFGSFNDTFYVDPDSGRVISFRDNPEYFDGAVQDAMKKLSWVVKNGYQDLYVGWEIGNECYTFWDPEMYALYAAKIAKAARAIQPDIRLAVPVILRDTDDAAIKKFIASDPSRKDWFNWHEKMFAALGGEIKNISHLQIHVYGSASPYSANFRGLENIGAILAKSENTGHFRFFVTEWRYTGVGGTDHRTFRTASLWNAKFAMTLLAHPRVDESAAHEFLCTSGLGYWTPGKGNAGPNADGSEWVFQYPENAKSGSGGEYRSENGKPAFDIGPFGPVNRLLNELIRDCPILVEKRADLGPMSSALFADGFTDPKAAEKNRDLEWIVSRTADGTRFGGVIVNTTAETVRLRPSIGKAPFRIDRAWQMTCDPARINVPEIPGGEKPWQVSELSTEGGVLVLKPDSITSFRAARP